MNKNFYQEGRELYLSKSYLKRYASPKTMEFWGKEMGVIKTVSSGESYFLYKSIPHRTRKKLPSPEKIVSQETKNSVSVQIAGILKEAFYYNAASYKALYEGMGCFTSEQVTKVSRLHSVFQSILDLKKETAFRDLIILYKEFNSYFPDKYDSKNALSNAIRKASLEGVTSVSIDGRCFGNNDNSEMEESQAARWVAALFTSSAEKFTNPVIHERANTYFRENGMREYSLSWIKKKRAEWLKNVIIYGNRYGQIEAAKKMPYATMKHATHSNIQWQIDGMDIPYWENRGDKKAHKAVLVFVIDTCSKKIIGYAIGDVENGELIKTAIRSAVKNTGVLPNELVMDNHSFTRTESLNYFETVLNSLGGKITKTSNPQHKAIVERFGRKLLTFFKEYPNYLGHGALSKSIDLTMSKEQGTKNYKQLKNRPEIIAITVKVIQDYNNTPQKGKTPNEKYDQNPHLSPIKPNIFEAGQLMPHQCVKRIRRGQITFQIADEKLEFELPSSLYQKWNDRNVLAAYGDLVDGIIIYEQVSGKGIAHLKIKESINNAKALQTEDDIIKLNKRKGKRAGIQNAAKKELETLAAKVYNRDPQAYLRISPLLVQKDIIKELASDNSSTVIAEEKGVIINQIYSNKPEINVSNQLIPRSPKNRNPIAIKPGHKVEMIDPRSLIENDDCDET